MTFPKPSAEQRRRIIAQTLGDSLIEAASNARAEGASRPQFLLSMNRFAERAWAVAAINEATARLAESAKHAAHETEQLAELLQLFKPDQGEIE